MLTRLRATVLLAVCFAATLVSVGCEKVPLLAPTGSSITLSSPTNVVPSNSSLSIVAQVIEASGTPPHSGTQVTFTTSLGTIEPEQAQTDSSGRVTVKFSAGGSSGIATVTAISGGASTGSNGALKIYVGTAAVGRVTLNANPASLPANGGSTTLTADVFDINSNPLPGATVSFTTTFGTLSSSSSVTNGAGAASTTLTTGQTAVVTATVGAQAPSTGSGSGSGGGSGSGSGAGSGSGTPSTTGQASATFTVNISPAPQLIITPPDSAPQAGLPAVFTFAITVAAGGNNSPAGATVRDVTVNWGDGRVQSLGALNGTQKVSHTYSSPGTYTISAVVTDAAGNTQTVTSSVGVIPVASPTIIVTPTPQSAPGGSTISFRIEIQVPSGLAVQNVVIDWGDGSNQTIGGFSGVITISHTYGAGVRTYTVTVNVTDSTGRTTTGSTTVSITT